MDVFVLMGCIAYEGDYLLGVYHTREDAEFARDHYIETGGEFDSYEIQARVIGARAEWRW
jgi:hypothetical protein